MSRYPYVTGSLVVVALLLVLTWWIRHEPRPDARPPTENASGPDHAGSHRANAGAPTAAAARDTPAIESLDLATTLNAPGSTIEEDLRVLDGVFAVWQTNFLGEGNPVGENDEITRALTGANRLHVAFLSPDHPAIDDAGRLCDRWGTPFFFHQLDGYRMEIISAGPDRRRGTEDDRRFSPPGLE